MAKRLILRLLFTLCLTASIHVRAAEEFTQTIPTELAKLLLDFDGNNDFAIYDGIMDEFPELNLPSGFTAIGSLRQSGMLRLALMTTMTEEQAMSVIGETLSNEGWVTMPEMNPFPREGGFVTANAPRASQARWPRYCRDDYGFLSSSYSSRGGVNYVLLTANTRRGMFGFNSRDCQSEIENLQRSISMRAMRGNTDLSRFMPRMELPGEQNSGYSPFAMAGMSGSSREMSTEVSIEIDWELDDLYEHIAEQISEQQWSLDSESSGEITASGTWVREVEETGNLIGALTVTNSGENRFDLQFVIRSPGARSGGTFIRAN